MNKRVRFNYLFYVAYILFIINSTFIKNVDVNIYKLILIFNIFLFLMNVLFREYKIKQLFKIIIIGIVIAIISINARELDLIILYIIIVASMGFDFDKLIKLDLVSRSIGVILTISLSSFNIAKDFLMYRVYADGVIQIRHSLGFIHPNTLSTNIFIILLSYIYLRYKKINLMDFIIIVSISYAFKIITGSRTFIMCLGVILILIFINKKIKIFQNKLLKNTFIIIVPICTIISIILAITYRYNIPIIEYLNTLFTGRIKSASYFLTDYGVSMFGQLIDLVSVVEARTTFEQQRILDNLYIKILVNFGVIAIVIYNWWQIKLMKLFLEMGNQIIAILMFSISIYGILESIVIAPSCCLLIMPISYLLLKKV